MTIHSARKAFVMNRRKFLGTAGAALAAMPYPLRAWETAARAAIAPDYRLRIAPCILEIGKGIRIATVAYDGQVPGPTLRLKKDKPVTIEVTNASKTPDLVHWHGLRTDPLNDGAVEEGSPLIAPSETLRYQLAPSPSGTRWYHTHAMAMGNLSLSTYTGQFGFLLVDGVPDPGAHDREVNLAIHHWEPRFVPMVDTMRAQSQNVPQTTGSDVGYAYATMNAHMLGAGEPIRVNQVSGCCFGC
jgi:FtsP/CotA-like multicopper oxidase with cupredoxin domain